MNDHAQPLARFKSRISGKNADVMIWPDRIEWSRVKTSKAKVGVGVLTAGLSLAATGVKGQADSEVVPVSAITSVSSSKDGLRHTVVQVRTAAGVVEFRCPHDDAAELQRLIMELVTATN